MYSFYRGFVLFFVNQAMEDTFIGGNVSDISISLWFIIGGIFTLITFLFLFLIKIKDLKSQKIILVGITVFWLIISIISIFISITNILITFLTFVVSIFCYLSIKTLKKKIITELNKKGLTEKEIYLLQQLAGINKK
tara:strand:+ start:81 stop:491 length:411 start_codon:yes stop_codon:yes gene_type:complete